MNSVKLLIILCSIVSSLSAGEIVFDDLKDFKTLKKNGLQISKNGFKEYRLELSKKKLKPTELLLDFENKKASELKDKTGNYTITQATYSVVEDKNLMGKRYASFASSNSQIIVNTNNKRLLNSSYYTEEFYFSFFIIPGESEQYSVIFSKTSITGGKKYGLECNIVNNKLEVNFHNMFYQSKHSPRTFSLKSPDKLKPGEWTQVVFTLDPISGEANLYENGDKKDSFLAIKSPEEPTSLPFGFHPNDTTPLIIGKDFYGKFDNFEIGQGKPDFTLLSFPYKAVNYDDSTKYSNHPRGLAYSKVLSTPLSHSKLLSIESRVNQPEGTHYEIHYRISDRVFPEDALEPAWIQKPEKDSELKQDGFKYFQWRVLLRSDYSGKKTPAFEYIKIKYQDSLPPVPPTGLKISENKKSNSDPDKLQVCLSWISNYEQNVRWKGRYFIHYGLSPDRMVGTILVNHKGKPINGLSLDFEEEILSGKEENNTVPVLISKEEQEKKKIQAEEVYKKKYLDQLNKKYTSLEQCIDNELISINAGFRKEQNMLMFKPGITYYFRVSAANNNYSEEKARDQKSGLSKSVLFTFKTDTAVRN